MSVSVKTIRNHLINACLEIRIIAAVTVFDFSVSPYSYIMKDPQTEMLFQYNVFS